MTIIHHPNEETLLDYASGALGEAWSVAVATHLAVCPECRKTVSELESVAGSFLGASEEVKVDDSAFDYILERLNQEGERPVSVDCSPTNQETCLPNPLREYAGGDIDSLKWRRLGPSAHQLVICSDDDGSVARLLRIPAGKPVPEHGHGGEEMTLVLRGAFEDHLGVYQRGDVQTVDSTITHKPFAVPGEECICLAVTNAPLRFSSLAARFLQPVVGI
ncbi:MAG: ChrR family anti-sigma-E factor [Pseudomonadota bacterium]|nr:ChrR family anti-sigma-E factor [Pseudomonadota bacterium]